MSYMSISGLLCLGFSCRGVARLRYGSFLDSLLSPALVVGLMLAHIPHAILHIAWGLAGMLFLLIFHSRRALIGLGLVFGTFYSLLGIIGVLVNNAFGFPLVLSE